MSEENGNWTRITVRTELALEIHDKRNIATAGDDTPPPTHEVWNYEILQINLNNFLSILFPY